jgi:hypothetical protein
MERMQFYNRTPPSVLEGTLVEVHGTDDAGRDVYHVLPGYGLLPHGWAVLEPGSGEVYSATAPDWVDVWPTLEEAIEALQAWNDVDLAASD